MERRTVAAISSHVMRGAVGLRPIGFALERRGATVWSVPTVLLPWHPGLGRSSRTVPAEFADQLVDLATRAAEVDAVLTGYFATAAQVLATAQFIDAVRKVRPDVPILVDPVTGDEAGRYVPDEVAEAIRAELLPRADLATPNANELADLANGGDVVAAARRLGPKRVFVTSAPVAVGRTGAMLVTSDSAVLASHSALPHAPRGTGDLFSAVLLSAILDGASDEDALRDAAAATFAVIAVSTDDLLAFAAGQDAIANPPRAMVELSAVDGHPRGPSAGFTPDPQRRRSGRQPATTRIRNAGGADAEVDGAIYPHPDVDPATVVFGVDGCPAGWAVARISASGPADLAFSVLADLAPLVATGSVIAVDMPIGLPDRITGPGRVAEQAVRRLLGLRQSSVFSVPARDAVYASDYAGACAAALAGSEPPRKVSQQAFAIFPRIRELDALLTPADSHVFEGHPEVAFWRLNDGVPMQTGKKVTGVPTREGLEERIALLARHGIDRGVFAALPKYLPLIDAVDAAAMALIARRCATGAAVPFPDPPGVDSRGLRIAIWA